MRCESVDREKQSETKDEGLGSADVSENACMLDVTAQPTILFAIPLAV